MSTRTNTSNVTKPTAKSQSGAKSKKPGGGTAAGGGINFQAAVTAIAGAHLLRGTAIGWLTVTDVPIAIWAESEDAGDDVRVELRSGQKAEVQAKKGLTRGKVWDALEAMVAAIRDGALDHAVLAVAPDSSRTVREDLATTFIAWRRGAPTTSPTSEKNSCAGSKHWEAIGNRRASA